jgi:hypothetical protein
VWCNDFNEANRTALVHNLCSSARVPLPGDGDRGDTDDCAPGGGGDAESGRALLAADGDAARGARPGDDVGRSGEGGGDGGCSSSGSRGDGGDPPLEGTAGGSGARVAGVSGRARAWDSAATRLSLPGLKKPAWQWEGRARAGAGASGAQGMDEGEVEGGGPAAGAPRVRVSHMDAKRLLAGVALAEDYFDLVDVDSFGSDTSFLGSGE